METFTQTFTQTGKETVLPKQKKTNAMRILDREGVKYSVMEYQVDDGKIDGISVAGKIKRDPGIVFKTLVVQGGSGENYVCVIPVTEELSLKKAAVNTGERKIDLVAVRDIQNITGYIRGGCSPIGMKKMLKTWIDSSAEHHISIIVSGGRIGTQIEIAVKDLSRVIRCQTADLIS